MRGITDMTGPVGIVRVVATEVGVLIRSVSNQVPSVMLAEISIAVSDKTGESFSPDCAPSIESASVAARPESSNPLTMIN